MCCVLVVAAITLQLNTTDTNKARMVKKVEQLIVEWLKSDNENATYIAHKICALFGVSKRFEIDFDGHLKADVQIEDNTPHIHRAVNGYGQAVNCDKVEIKQV
jgi:hypothetical protein